eukprot:m.53855 g.53855  ORF g.53855 m.53855 type:complete len:798 (-) comp15471_c1_seq1:129-2522(-)
MLTNKCKMLIFFVMLLVGASGVYAREKSETLLPTSLTWTKVGPDTNALVIANGFVQVAVDISAGNIISMVGDFNGTGQFLPEKNILSSPWKLESSLLDDDTPLVSSSSASPTLHILVNTTTHVSVKIDGITDKVLVPRAKETWMLSLFNTDRGIELNVTGMTTNEQVAKTSTIRHSATFKATSITALYDRGVVQMRGLNNQFFGSEDRLGTVYALGGGSAVEILRRHAGTKAATVLLSAPQNGRAGSGFYDLWTGTVTPLDKWTKTISLSATSNTSAQMHPSRASSTWTASFVIAPNDRNFPALNMTTGPNLPDTDLEAMMTGLYGSSPGCLCTYDNEVVPGKRVAQIATTIARPSRGYSGTYNYFDPDNFISLSALQYSGEPYLQNQARLVIERSGAFLLDNGQLPHHFVDDKPQYTALSGATQTGPNTFWTKSALRYAHVTGDIDWLRGYMPTLRKASSFCFNLIDPERHLLNAPGSLMIDVFIRNNFTADSNAMLVGFLREFADAEEILGNVTGATHLRQLASAMATAMNADLWAADGVGLGGNDHYVTQLNPDGTTRDFMDYDSNLIAVAHSIPSLDRAQKILSRIDGGKCAAANGGGPQYVSEVYYGKNDTTNGNTGDSSCSMGRIAWFDSHARKNVGNASALQVFDTHTLAPLMRDLIAYTWLHERYGCDGKQQDSRTEAYFEYPATVTMLLREIRYGIDVGLRNITINPFGPTEYNFHIGNINVDYTAESGAVINVAGEGTRTFTIHGMTAGATYGGACSFCTVCLASVSLCLCGSLCACAYTCVLSVWI